MGENNLRLHYIPPGLLEAIEKHQRGEKLNHSLPPGSFQEARVPQEAPAAGRDPSDWESNWYDFNHEAGVWDFTKTEDHIFAPYAYGGRRIGDMSREELLEVIAAGYHEREELARAVVALEACGGVDASEMGLEDVVDTAVKIIDRADGPTAATQVGLRQAAMMGAAVAGAIASIPTMTKAFVDAAMEREAEVAAETWKRAGVRLTRTPILEEE